MRRYAYILLFFLVLVLPFIMRHWLAKGAGDSAAMAPAGGQLVIITPHNQDIRREFAEAFGRWHVAHYGTYVELDYRSLGGSTDIEQLLTSTYSAYRDKAGALPPQEKVNVGYDVAWGGGDYLFNKLRDKLHILTPLDAAMIRAAIPDPRLAGTPLYDYTSDNPKAPIAWVGVCLSSFGIVYNPDLLHSMGLAAPSRWQDLADPRLSGMVALADPTHSGSAAVAYIMVLQRSMADAEDAFFASAEHQKLKKLPRDKWSKSDQALYNIAIAAGWKSGMATMLRIAANARYFTDSAEQVPTDVGNGDAACGMAIDFYGRVEEATVGARRARFIAPRAATAITPDPVAILYGCTGKQRELANHFVEFLLSDEGQLLWIKQPGTPMGPRQRGLGRPPIRKALYADQTGWSDPVNPFNDAGTFNLRGAWMATSSELSTIWAAAWIDDRDALRQAYRRILAVKDDALRQRLLAELADLPIDMNGVLAAMSARSTAPAADSGLLAARARMEYADRFRAHYARIVAEAIGH